MKKKKFTLYLSILNKNNLSNSIGLSLVKIAPSEINKDKDMKDNRL